MSDKTIDKHSERSGKFHWLFLSGGTEVRPRYDKILRETENFVVVPTLGSIVPGWVLLIPKHPLPRFADLDITYHEELRKLSSSILYDLENKFGDTFVFEHGGYAGSKISCGVDQAHLHFAPLPFDLLKASVSDNTLNWRELEPASLWYSVHSGSEYLFIRSKNKAAFSEVDIPVSQWFRKLIAERMGCAEEWDYKQHQFYENIEQTIKVVSRDD